MSELTRIALLGFTEFERSTIESFLKHGAAGEPPREVVHELWRADCAVANADDEAAIGRLRHASLISRSVLLGSTPQEGAALQLPRPINLALVARALDTLVGVRTRPRAGPMPPPGQSGSAAPQERTPPLLPPRPVGPVVNHVQRVLDELAYRTAPLPPDVDAHALARAGAPDATAAPADARAAGGPLPLEHVLVVTPAPQDFRLIVLSLEGFGFQTHLAQAGDAALRLLARRPHRYAFIDPLTPGADALQLCRIARAGHPGTMVDGATVVLLVDPQGSSEALQRALPSADATLRRPLSTRELLRLVGDREVQRYAYADTVQAVTRF